MAEIMTGLDTSGLFHLEAIPVAMQYSRRTCFLGGKDYGLGGIQEAVRWIMDGLHFESALKIHNSNR